MYIAHYDHNNTKEPHSLDDHVKEMRKMINSFNLTFDSYHLTEASAILHDLGKKCKRFQKYVLNPHGKRGSVKHAVGGAYALSRKNEQVSHEKRFLMEMVQLIVAGHHTGLADYDKCFFDRLNALPPELEGIECLGVEEVEEVLTLLDSSPLSQVLEIGDQESQSYYLATLVRFAMSALVDADYLSTEAYFSNNRKQMRSYEAPSFSQFLRSLQQYINKSFVSGKRGILNDIKKNIQKKARQAGKQRHSFYTLHAPTGTGKTIAALEFAVNHAKAHGKSRIITALPLMNLTEEISEIYRKIFGEQHVIEDHSNLPLSRIEESPIRLATENYDRKFIVTTTVQLFESLFHNYPTKLRKLHRLTDSIIILDEYHKLPYHLLEPILRQLDILQKYFNVTVLMMSATPFPFYESKGIREMNLINLPIEITDDQKLFAQVPSRLKFERREKPLNLDQLAKHLLKEKAVLAIVNTRKEAQQLHHALVNKDHAFENVYHVSTTMCSTHRDRVLKEVKRQRDPENPRPIAVISTGILEAGIDISFPVIYRMIAPLEAIVQAAGRCNRYGEIEQGRVVLFENIEKNPVNFVYEAGIGHTKYLLETKGLETFSEPHSFKIYYKRIFGGDSDLNQLDINAQKNLCFKSISDSFKMIEDKRISVVCTAFKGFKQEWLTEKKTRLWWHKIQPYTIPLTPSSSNYKIVNDINIYQGTYDDNYGVIL